MSTRSFSHHTRLAFALMIAVLIGLPTAGAFADKGDKNGKSDPGKHSAKSAQTQNSRSDSRTDQSGKSRDTTGTQNYGQPSDKSVDQTGRQSYGQPSGQSKGQSAYRPNSRTTYQLDGRDRGKQFPGTRSDTGGKLSVDKDKSTDYRPRVTTRPPVVPDQTYGHNYNPGPNDGKKSALPPVNARGYGDNRYGDNRYGDNRYGDNRYSVSRPRGYTPPTNRGGRYYYSDRPNYKPMRYGHWVFRNYDSAFNRRSTYFYFGFFPYLETARIHIAPYLNVTYINRPARIYSEDYYLSRNADTQLGYALSDIRNAWLNGRADLLDNHVYSGQMIAVLLDGRYDYSLDGTDYTDMTADAISQIRTVSFTWQQTRERTNGDFTAFGKHVYRDDYGATKTVYVSYTLHRTGREYVIVEVGSSDRPLY